MQHPCERKWFFRGKVDDVTVNRAGFTQHRFRHRTVPVHAEATPRRDSHYELGGVDTPGKIEQSFRDGIPGNLVQTRAYILG